MRFLYKFNSHTYPVPSCAMSLSYLWRCLCLPLPFVISNGIFNFYPITIQGQSAKNDKSSVLTFCKHWLITEAEKGICWRLEDIGNPPIGSWWQNQAAATEAFSCTAPQWGLCWCSTHLTNECCPGKFHMTSDKDKEEGAQKNKKTMKWKFYHFCCRVEFASSSWVLGPHCLFYKMFLITRALILRETTGFICLNIGSIESIFCVA